MFQVVKAYYKWIISWKTLPVYEWVKGAKFYKLGEYKRASEHYRKGLELYPTHVANICARLDLAYCYFKIGKLKEAEDELKFVTTISPSCGEAFLRLAEIQMWSGISLEACWTLRRAIKYVAPTPEMIALFILSALDSDGPRFLLKEALHEAEKLKSQGKISERLKIAIAKNQILRGDFEFGKEELQRFISQEKPHPDALIAYSEMMLELENLKEAREVLKRALNITPNHPRILSLLAETYLDHKFEPNPEFAIQLATSASQATNWQSPREMHILAKGYFEFGDKLSALLIASKAKEAGNKLLSAYKGARYLDDLINKLNEQGRLS